MNDLSSNLFTIIVPLILSHIIYSKIDEKYDLTNKISSKLPVQEQWKAAFCTCIIAIIILIIWLINIFNFATNILIAVLIGAGNIITSKMIIRKNKNN